LDNEAETRFENFGDIGYQYLPQKSCIGRSLVGTFKNEWNLWSRDFFLHKKNRYGWVHYDLL